MPVPGKGFGMKSWNGQPFPCCFCRVTAEEKMNITKAGLDFSDRSRAEQKPAGLNRSKNCGKCMQKSTENIQQR